MAMIKTGKGVRKYFMWMELQVQKITEVWESITVFMTDVQINTSITTVKFWKYSLSISTIKKEWFAILEKSLISLP
jgi:hypothetical protein